MDRWEFYQDGKGGWRWRCRSADSHALFDSTESFQSRGYAVADAATRGFTARLGWSGYNPYDTASLNVPPHLER